MNPRTPLSLLLYTLLLWTVDYQPTTAAQRPNFIFFITDDISARDLGPYGNTAIKTPNLDHIAKDGVVFDNAYVVTSSCSPSRCAIITGRYPHNNGAPELGSKLPADQWKKDTGDSVPTNPTPNRQPLHERSKMNKPFGEFPGTANNATTINHPGPIHLKSK